MRILELIIVYLSLNLALAFGQTNTKISGLVLDQVSLSPVSGATVIVQGTSYAATTDDKGSFQFENLPAGQYRLQARSLGYHSQLGDLITVSEDLEVRLTLKLMRQPIPLPELVVPVEKERPGFENLPSQKVVLTQEQIQRSSAASLSEILNSISGVYVQQAGPTGSARISIRGSATDQVLILLNGVRINSAQTGEADLSAVPTSQVKRIEITKGANTAQYGADALAGVIDIITTAASAPKLTQIHVKNMVGSFGTRLWELGIENNLLSGLGVSASFTKPSSNGDFTYPDSGKIFTRTNSGKTSENVYLNLNLQTSLKHQADLTFFKYFARKQLPGPLLQTNDSAYMKDARQNLTFNSTYQLTSKLFASGKSGYQSWGQTYRIQEEYYIPVNVNYSNRQWETETRLNLETENSRLSWGVSYSRASLRGTDRQRPALSIGNVQRSTFSTFVSGQKEIKEKLFDRIVFSSAFRYDRTSRFQANWSPQLGLLLSEGKDTNLKLRANWGKSYHNPSLNALFWKEDAYASGNPSLKPERATNFEAGIEFRLPVFRELVLGQIYFHDRIRDLIVWQRSFDGKYSPSNVNHASLDGYEQYLLWQVQDGMFELEFNHTRSDAINQTETHTKSGNLIPFRPRHQYNFKCYFKSEKFDFFLQSRYSSSRYTREQNTPEKILPDYTIWDLGLKFKHRLHAVHFSLAVNVHNLTDQYLELIERYPMPGREFRLTTQIELSKKD